MPKYRATLQDGRTVDVYAPNTDIAASQAAHHEATRVSIAQKRKIPQGPSPSQAVDFKVIKERA